jgi:hypothetical protein
MLRRIVAAQVAADGNAPPKPTPVRKRHRLNVAIEPEKAVRSEEALQ